jgi:hypothetical protein
MNSQTARPRSRRQAAAFTLVDLLAIICVLAIGFALLTPALARTQPNTPDFQCFNNLRQLGRAFLMYAGDNAERLSYPNWGWTSDGWLYPNTATTGGTIPDPTLAPYKTNPVLAYQRGMLWSYVNRLETYRCPLDKTNTSNWRMRSNKLSTYVMNGAVCGYGGLSSGGTYKLADFRPDAFIMWEPDYKGLYGMPGFNDASSFPDSSEGIGLRHGKFGGIAATAGGGVEFVKYADWVKAASEPTKNRVWCNPGTANGR